jgi:hypothetical protein
VFADTRCVAFGAVRQGEFLHNMLQNQKTIVNCMAINEDGVMCTGGDNGSLWYVERRCTSRTHPARRMR